MLTMMSRLLDFIKKHPKKRYIYAVTGGKYLGELLVYIEDKANEYEFLSLPNMYNRSIPRDKFEIGITNNIVEVVEKLPSRVYSTCKQQYNKNVVNNTVAQ